MSNKLLIAAAGSGKTNFLIKTALSITNESVLITTYTEANAYEIKNKIVIENGCVPENITIQTWFSLLIRHGVKPYQSYLFDYKVKGMLLMNKRSGFRGLNESGFPMFYGEGDFNKHYFNKNDKIYSDKLSKLVCKINKASSNKVLKRLYEIFPNILIDECQDLAGYDLQIIKDLAIEDFNLIIVCDPRQVTYLTHHSPKFTKYKNGLIEEFIKGECDKIDFNIDTTTLSDSYRCNQLICDFSNKLYPNVKQCNSLQRKKTEHDGIFLVPREKLNKYLKEYKPVQLRWDIRTKGIDASLPVYNLGLSKGLTFDRVLIHPTSDMLNWMKDYKYNLKVGARAKFYVGVTRAKFSVGIVCDNPNDIVMDGVNLYK